MKHPTVASLLATAYLSSVRAPRALKTIKKLCYLGLYVGACALMLALIITHGFERDIGLKMKGISSDALIEAPGSQLDAQELTAYLNEHMPQAFKGISASSTRHIILTHENQSRVVFLRGIDGANEAQTTILESKICAPQGQCLATLLNSENALIIGKQCAIINKLWLGSEVTVYVPQEAGRTKLALEKKTMQVAGIFSVGLEDYDVNVAYCQHRTLSAFYENCTGADHLAVAFAPPPWNTPTTSVLDWCNKQYQKMRLGDDGYASLRLQQVAQLLPGLSVRGWRDLYPELVASLELEKYAISLVLALIALVASMLMICLLFMFIQYKQADIALLRTMGMSTTAIYWLFMRIGMTIVWQSSIAGIATACAVGWYIDTYKPIALPEIYYIAYLPAAVEPVHILCVAGGMLILGLIACQLPLWQLRGVSVVSLLRGS